MRVRWLRVQGTPPPPWPRPSAGALTPGAAPGAELALPPVAGVWPPHPLSRCDRLLGRGKVRPLLSQTRPHRTPGTARRVRGAPDGALRHLRGRGLIPATSRHEEVALGTKSLRRLRLEDVFVVTLGGAWKGADGVGAGVPGGAGRGGCPRSPVSGRGALAGRHPAQLRSTTAGVCVHRVLPRPRPAEQLKPLSPHVTGPKHFLPTRPQVWLPRRVPRRRPGPLTSRPRAQEEDRFFP